VLDIINGGGERSVRDANDAVAHVLKDDTAIVSDDTDNQNVDRQKDIGWGANNGLASP
jgi:hypothetical protein